MKNWNWRLVAVIKWLLVFVTGVWAYYPQHLLTLGNLLLGISFISFLLYYIKNRKAKK
tara:strand:- start:1394 stop:1567 length:174 start_codon:yes stop_codon:yes gene_type:complete